MKRKTFLNRITLGSGAAVLLPSANLLQSCEYQPQMRTALSKDDISLLDEIGETIIPASEASPGAKATNIGDYMLLMYQDCMPSEEQAIFLAGLNELDARSASSFSHSFLKADAAQKLMLIEEMQKEATAYNLKMQDAIQPLPHYFNLFKGLTISGYFSSEIGMTQAREYLPVPGKFISCMPYKKEDKVWAL